MKLLERRVTAKLEGYQYEHKYWCWRCQHHFWQYNNESQSHGNGSGKAYWRGVDTARCPRCGTKTEGVTAMEVIKL